MRYLLLICGDESAAAHAQDSCGGWMDDMQERGALRAAARHPAAAYGTIEIRPFGS